MDNCCKYCCEYVNGDCKVCNIDVKCICDTNVCGLYFPDFSKIRADIYADIIDMIKNDKHCKECHGWLFHWCVACNGEDRERAIIDMLNKLIKECDDNGKS